jgi:hypothetical protein
MAGNGWPAQNGRSDDDEQPTIAISSSNLMIEFYSRLHFRAVIPINLRPS